MSVDEQVKAFEQEMLEQDPEFVKDAQERYKKQQEELTQPARDDEEMVKALKVGAEEAKQVRVKQLEKEIINEYQEINKSLDIVMYSDEKWWCEVAWDTLIKPRIDRISHLEAKVDHWLNPMPIDYSKDDIDDLKQLALNYPITKILNIQPKKGLIKIKCPLHADKTPSFTIYPTNTYHCFGCNESGSSIHLYRALHKTGYLETIKILSNS